MEDTMTVDGIFIEACIEDEEIEDGYFTENLKYIIDKEIEDEISSALGSIFNSDSETTMSSVVANILADAEEEAHKSEYVQQLDANCETELDVPDPVEDIDGMCSLMNRWADDDDNETDSWYRYSNDTGEYNAGYDSIFGEG